MNGVSDLPLALACWDAGIFPNLFLQDLSEESVYTTLSEFVKITKLLFINKIIIIINTTYPGITKINSVREYQPNKHIHTQKSIKILVL